MTDNGTIEAFRGDEKEAINTFKGDEKEERRRLSVFCFWR